MVAISPCPEWRARRAQSKSDCHIVGPGGRNEPYGKGVLARWLSRENNPAPSQGCWLRKPDMGAMHEPECGHRTPAVHPLRFVGCLHARNLEFFAWIRLCDRLIYEAVNCDQFSEV